MREDLSVAKLDDDIREFFFVEEVAFSAQRQMFSDGNNEESKSPLQCAGIGVCTARHGR